MDEFMTFPYFSVYAYFRGKKSFSRRRHRVFEVFFHPPPARGGEAANHLFLNRLPVGQRGLERLAAFDRQQDAAPAAVLLAGLDGDEPLTDEGFQVAGERGAVHDQHLGQAGHGRGRQFGQHRED